MFPKVRPKKTRPALPRWLEWRSCVIAGRNRQVHIPPEYVSTLWCSNLRLAPGTGAHIKSLHPTFLYNITPHQICAFDVIDVPRFEGDVPHRTTSRPLFDVLVMWHTKVHQILNCTTRVLHAWNRRLFLGGADSPHAQGRKQPLASSAETSTLLEYPESDPGDVY